MALVATMESRTVGTASVDNSYDRPVDLVHLARHTLGNRDLEREVLQLFVRQSAVYLGRLRAAHSAGDRRMAAHTIKGSARGIGAWLVADLADVFEKMPDDATDFENTDYSELTKAIEEANAYIRDVLADE